MNPDDVELFRRFAEVPRTPLVLAQRILDVHKMVQMQDLPSKELHAQVCDGFQKMIDVMNEAGM